MVIHKSHSTKMPPSETLLRFNLFTYATIDVVPPGPTPTLTHESARNCSGFGVEVLSIDERSGECR